MVGARAGNPVAEPESVLGAYDVVFAKGRCALEALATGCAVIVADFSGLGGLVRSENVECMRRLNLGVRTMQAGPVTEDSVDRELQRYCPRDAAAVTQRIRSEAGLSAAVDRLLEIYADVLNASCASADAGCEPQCTAAAHYLRYLASTFKTRDVVAARAHSAEKSLEQANAGWEQSRSELHRTRSDLEHARSEVQRTQSDLEQVRSEVERTRSDLDRATVSVQQAEDRAVATARELAEIHSSRAWRAVSWYRTFKSRWWRT